MLSRTKLLKAIHKNCIECCAGITSEVKNCVMKECPLYPYRMGVQQETRTAE